MSQNQPKLTRHPSFGYCTDEQLKKLQSLGIGAERTKLIKTIEKQQKSKGKSV